VEAAGITRLVYGNFIRVWREKEADLQESRIKRILLFNLSHECELGIPLIDLSDANQLVRTPLNAVVNFLEMAMEETCDKSIKPILSLSHNATKSLIYVIDDLLNLTAGAKQPVPLAHRAFDLPKALKSILDQFQSHAHKKLLTFDVITDIGFPRFVFGDLQRLQQAVSSLVTNSIQYTDQGYVIIHLGVLATTPGRCIIRISVQDSGIGISQHELDDLFQELEQVSDEEGNVDQTSDKVQPSQTTGNKSSKLGLGLALLSRYIKVNSCSSTDPA
jgi:signal transduction histidine kinase